MKGVKQVVTLEPYKPPHAFQPLGGVAVIADNTWAAFQGRKELKIEWSSSRELGLQLGGVPQDAGRDVAQAGKVVRNVGDVDAAFAKGGKIMEAEYYTPHLAHASMETSGCRGRLPRWQGGDLGADAESAGRAETVASVLGIKPEDVTCMSLCWAAASDASRSPTRWPKRRCCRRRSASR